MASHIIFVYYVKQFQIDQFFWKISDDLTFNFGMLYITRPDMIGSVAVSTVQVKSVPQPMWQAE